MPTLGDWVALFNARMTANDPTWALDDTADIVKITKAVLAFDLDTNAAINANTPNFFIYSASDGPLAAKAVDYGYNASLGVGASGGVVFKLSAPSVGVTTIPNTTVLQVAGDGVTTPTLSYATQTAASIPNGATSSGTSQTSTLTFNGAPTFNTTTFTVTVGALTTGTISYQTNGTTTATNIQTALNTLLGSGNTIVASVSATVYTIQFVGALSGLIETVSAALVTAGGGTSITSAITAAVAGVTYTCTTTGLNTNIAAGTTLIIQNPVASGLTASNATADGGTAFAGGLDPDSDGTVRANALKNILPKYNIATLIQAMLAVTGVYDAWVFDPQNASGLLGYAFCDANGNVGGATGLNTIPTSGSVTVQTPTIPVGSLADQVRTAVHNALPPGMAATGSTLTAYMYGFNVQLLTSIPITYSAPAAIQSTSLGPQIQQAVINYIQGSTFTSPSFAVPATIGPQSGLYHGLALVQFPLQAYVSAATGGVLTNFTLAATTPASTTASNSIVYRALAGTGSVVLTRV